MITEQADVTGEKKLDFLANWQFQDYLSFGYIYLLLLGIVSDSIYYGMVGINVISYSTILDVLLSPIVRLTDNIVLPAIIIVLPVIGYFYVKLIVFLEKRKHEKMKKNDNSSQKIKLQQLSMRTVWFAFTCLIIFTTFMGYGVGGGSKQREYLETGEFKTNKVLEFQDGRTEAVRVIGNNSEYVFYLEVGKDTVSVSPIKDNIRVIRATSE